VRVEVRLYATLAARRPGCAAGAPFDVTLQSGTSLAGLLDALGIASPSVHLTIVNGRVVHDRASGLSDGDRVALFPPVGGG